MVGSEPLTPRRDDELQRALRFAPADVDRAFETWGANCGPAAIAAIASLTLEELRPHTGSFKEKGYTNPSLMWSMLDSIGATWRRVPDRSWPRYGLARVQWEGPWTRPGAPAVAAYRHTHWIGACDRRDPDGVRIFDVNAIDVGGWIGLGVWVASIVPSLTRRIPRASGAWHLTHVVEVEGLADLRATSDLSQVAGGAAHA